MLTRRLAIAADRRGFVGKRFSFRNIHPVRSIHDRCRIVKFLPILFMIEWVANIVRRQHDPLFDMEVGNRNQGHRSMKDRAKLICLLRVVMPDENWIQSPPHRLSPKPGSGRVFDPARPFFLANRRSLRRFYAPAPCIALYAFTPVSSIPFQRQ